MKTDYIMLDVTDNEDHNIYVSFVCNTIESLQRLMEEYLKEEESYPKFLILTADFHEGILCSKDYIFSTHYRKKNGITIPIIEI